MFEEDDLSHISKAQLFEYHCRKKMSDNLYTAKSRCKDSDIPFTIQVEDLAPFPVVCPVFGTKLDWFGSTAGGTDASPSMDRLDPSKGYVPGNVTIISNRANRIKNDANLEEIKAVLDWFERSSRASLVAQWPNPAIEKDAPKDVSI